MMMKTSFIQLASVEVAGRRYRVGVIPEDSVSGEETVEVGSLWRSIRRAARRADPRTVAKAVARYAHEVGVRRPLELTARAARIAQLAASGDSRALSLALSTARDAARGIPGAVVAYKAIRAFDQAYRSRPVQLAVSLAETVPAASAVTSQLRLLGQGARLVSSSIGAPVY